MKFKTIHNWSENYVGESNNSPSLTCQDDGVMDIYDYFCLYGLDRVDTREYCDCDDYADEKDFKDGKEDIFNNVSYYVELEKFNQFNPKTYIKKDNEKRQNNDAESHPDEVKDNDSEVIPGVSD